MAVLTIVAHFLHVIATGGIGFAGYQAAVGILAHATGIRHFHPFHRININTQVPLVHLVWIDTGQHTEITGHHEPLNVMGVSKVQ